MHKAVLISLNGSTVKQYKLSDGSLADSFEGIEAGSVVGANTTIAVDDQFFYTWDPSAGTVHVYDLNGTFIKNLKLQYGNYGYSLSYANGYLFVSYDGGGGTGYWYGYNIRKPLNPAHQVITPAIVQPVQKVKLPEGDTTTDQ